MGRANEVYLILVVVLLASLSKCSFAQGDATYVVVAPQIVRAGSTYDVVVTILAATSSVNVDVSLRNQRNVSVASNSMIVSAGSTTTAVLQIPSVLSETQYTLAVHGTGGITFYQTRTVQVKSKTLSIFIQTDKAMYKPSQEVLFRVITVYPDLKPYMQEINVSISDNADNKIAQWINQRNDTGVFSSSLQLSDQPPLGSWVITVTAAGNTVKKKFTVAEYVLPKFEVTVDLPSYYLLFLNAPSLQKNLHATVTAKYTYGQPVRGRAEVSVSTQPWYDGRQYGSRLINVQLEEGKADIEVTVDELIAMMPRRRRYDHYSGYYYDQYVHENNPTAADLQGRYVVVAANVTEAATDITLSGNNTVVCTSQKYNLVFLDITPTSFKPGLSLSAYLQLQQHDGSPPLTADIESNKVSVVVTTSYRDTARPWYTTESSSTWNLTVPASGIMTLTIPVDANGYSISMTATFRDSSSNTVVTADKSIEIFESRDGEGIQILLSNSSGLIEAGQTVTFAVTTTADVTFYSYQLLSKGIVFGSGSQTGSPSTEHRLSITIDSSLAQKLAPTARIVVWYITELGEIVSDSLDFAVNGAFDNEVSVRFSDDTVRPADTVSVSVAAHPASYVGLLAVDQSVLLLRQGNDITQDSVLQDLSSYESKSSDTLMRRPWCWWPYFSGGTNSEEVFANAGVLVMTDAYVENSVNIYRNLPPAAYSGGVGFTGVVQIPRSGVVPARPGPLDPAPAPDDRINPESSTNVRSNFPETWIWTDATTGADGQTTLTATIPDTITSWVLSAFAINPDVGLGVTPESAKITAFKPFFISLTLPYSAKRGEEFALQVTVFNYLSTPLKATVTLKESDYFKVRAPNNILPQKLTVSAPVEVSSMDAMSTYFWIVPDTLGQIPFEVSAVSGLAADAVRRMLLVEPEGIATEYSTATFISLSDGETYSSTLNISFPADGDLVPGSQYIELTAIGDLMGQSLDGLGNLLQMPYGCGEQNMLHFAPDVYILKYFEATGKTDASIETKAEQYIKAGYQRELTYQRSDGSFSAFGNSDKAGSMWLSAFVAKCFHEAKDFIPVDDKKIAATLNWMIMNQARDGSFPEPPYGRVLRKGMQGGSASGVSLTAYVLISLLENAGNPHVSSSSYVAARTSAVQYLESHLTSVSSQPYALSIISYALKLANSSLASSALQQLNRHATVEDGLKYWQEAASDDSTNQDAGTWRAPYERARSVDIEMTAYGLLTYVLNGDLSGAVSIAKWLVSQRNSLGGFSSTQDTVVALQALAEYAALTSGNNDRQNLVIAVTADTLTHRFTPITALNALVLQSVQIPSTATEVSLHATGTGVGLVQLNVKFHYYGMMTSSSRHTTTDAVLPQKNITLHLVQEQVDDVHITLQACARWLSSEVSGMSIMEINTLTGYRADNLDQLQSQSSTVKRVDSDKSKIIFYLDELTSNVTCFTVQQTKSMFVDKVKPASVSAYLYYDPSKYETLVYQPVPLVNSSWCYQCPICCLCNAAGFYRCRGENGPCITAFQKCDGIRDCQYGDDEIDSVCGAEAMTSSRLLTWLFGVSFILRQLLAA